MTAITAQTINTQNHGPNKAAVSGHDHSHTQDHDHGPNCGCPSHKHEHKEVEAKHKHDQPDVKTNKTDKDSVAEIQDKLFGKLVNHSEQTGEKMEKLGILEFRIYGVLSLASAIINGFRGRVALPNSTLFANFAESMPEILTKVLQQDKEKAFKKLSGGGLNGLLGKFAIKAANLRGIKNKDGSKITTIKDVMANRDKVTGATITTINGISFSNMLAMMGSDEDGVVSELINAEHKGMGVQVAQVSVDQKQGALVYMPNHPNADEDGNVEMSNVDSAEEMINMMEAVRQYKANLSIVEMAKKAAQEAMNMTKNG